ncbi:MAG: anthranilate synthase family protein [Propionibacteriaceae bacterium]
MTDLLDEILAGQHESFALLHRPDSSATRLDVIVGPARRVDRLSQLNGDGDPEQLVVIPYRTIAERGFACVDDGAAIVAIDVRAHQVVALTDALARLPHAPLTVAEGDFDLDDVAYADTVRRMIDQEIGQGTGANFVLKRTFGAQVGTPHRDQLLSVLRALLERERGAYWTFLVRAAGLTWVGATPERHLGLSAGTVSMNPISGTYRYPDGGPDLAGVMAFLADDKETDELYMVVDEELKMMAGVCAGGGRLSGPYLKEMAHLAHTEYYLHGRTEHSPVDLLRRTLFAPTVIGSPLESACRVVARHEPGGRGYYGGVVALIGRDEVARPRLDSAILIRTAVLTPAGQLQISVGATVVRTSSPAAEAAETRAKAACLVQAFDAPRPALAGHPQVRAALRERNRLIGRFWLSDPPALTRAPTGAGTRVLVVDAEDTFTAMLAQQLESLGADVTVGHHDEPHDLAAYEVVVMGPGPGDPGSRSDPRIVALRAALESLLERHQPFLAICLSHQVLCDLLGLPVVRKPVPHQGLQREIDYFGRPARVGFYNTYCATSPTSEVLTWAGPVQVAADPVTEEVHALRGPHFHTMQFHPESILTTDGPDLLARVLTDLAPATSAPLSPASKELS